ncbi:VanR-ABDEGLN family response regulator transcription factor [Candidatus Stoquefichus sp. SB1]|jgi:two-component system response regulator VanR|uniref:VanR-ABDEGLN family response regulator transcription factor n=1 Tax=Candidatus Stoquefichus sp. SB1 TaxID=1658109 RepID=UPI00067EADA2|nr:VanR-ABDEGLN family response regulator transcription factor [Candidatus Stoquefichus sp. SB1]
MNILVVDDEKEIADLVELYLKNEGYTVYKFYNGTHALACVDKEEIDLAILDIMLPDIDGLTICQKIREHYNFPIIMLTAKETEIDKITGLTIGADDYVTKPFRPLELMARVKAQLRRYTSMPSLQKETVITIGALTIDQTNHQCTLNNQPLSLTPTEFSILYLLCSHKGKVVSVDQIYQDLWGEKYYTNSSSSVMVHIRHLREKMNDSAENPKYIQTIWGVGYKIG